MTYAHDFYMKKSVFSCLCMLTTWHCQHPPTACRCYRNRSISAACWAHSSKPAAVGLLLWDHAGTDRWADIQTLYCFTDPAVHNLQAQAVPLSTGTIAADVPPTT